LKVILATGLKELDRDTGGLLRQNGYEVAGECYYGNALVKMVKDTGAGLVILSPHLPLEGDFLADLLVPIREKKARVIFLPGARDRPETRKRVGQAAVYGVYDIVYDPVLPEKILAKIENPGDFSLVSRELNELGEMERQGLLQKFLDATRPIQEAVAKPKPKLRLPQVDLPSLRLKRNTVAGTQPALEEERVVMPVIPVIGHSDDGRGEEHLIYVLGDIESAGCGRIRGFRSVEELEDAARVEKPDGIAVPAGGRLLIRLSSLRRRAALASIPIIVIGACDLEAAYAAGADEQAFEITPEVLQRLAARKKRLEALWSRAVRDDLTGLYKRGFMEDCLREALESCRNNNVPAAFLICDMDYFKQVNDTYGHQAGDAVLKEFARFLCSSVREADIVARYGGEEFAVIFPRTEGETALTVAKRICGAWAEREINIGGRKVASTFSAGLAVTAPGMALADLIKAADQALYRAKEAGRNRVVAAWDKAVPAFQPVPPAGTPAVPAARPESVVNKAAREEMPRLSSLATPSPAREVPSPLPQPPPSAGESGGFSFVPMENMVLLYGATPGADAAGVAIELCRLLQKMRNKVALIEANFSSPGLGLRLGIPGEELWDRDWRIGGAGVGGFWQGIAAWLLDPWVKEVPPEEELRHILQDMIAAAVKLKSRWIVVVCDYNFPYFDALSRAAGYTLAVVRPGERPPLYGGFPGLLVKDREGPTEYPAYEAGQIVNMLRKKEWIAK